MDITGQLKVLKELAGETQNTDGTHSIILQHILPTTVEFIDRVNSIYPVDLVIAITYSADPDTVRLLKSKGYTVLVPADIDYMLNNLWKDVVAILSFCQTAGCCPRSRRILCRLDARICEIL